MSDANYQTDWRLWAESFDLRSLLRAHEPYRIAANFNY